MVGEKTVDMDPRAGITNTGITIGRPRVRAQVDESDSLRKGHQDLFILGKANPGS